MKKQAYFYKFLEPVSYELALIAKELENSIFTSPRVMLTHSRIFIEHLLRQVMEKEKVLESTQATLIEQINTLDAHGYITPEIRDALHEVRKTGNQAAHDPRKFRYSEALLSWEAVYEIVKWYVEVYGDLDVIVPAYQDPIPADKQNYDIQELITKLESLEGKLLTAIEQPWDEEGISEIATTIEEVPTHEALPGYTAIRKITYKDRSLEVPYFLRDTFLLPQRFDKSETFLIRLGAEQQARIMSELPSNMEGISDYVKRFNEKNEETLFDELSTFIDEEKVRKEIEAEHPGELFLFYKTDYIIVTKELSSIPLTEEHFTSIPNLLRQLHDDQINKVGQLPKELVILAKYDRVGVGTVEKLFEQLKGRKGG
ncbi:DUF4145 domain-containing protein [Oceanobacillus bengalensis]|uniref:DUF4145 domain-containing protein n=1 Tax=Oceanobacillus bengalensis TaxID=1435466 RepID=A0A494Z7S3_9BACI|nr:DUF4145 domain-containing protein [Oceanobacillus bengalensis]RKQ18566.1 DUF4145 domain-containing protein [Oceanobacillus bengalensis]